MLQQGEQEVGRELTTAVLCKQDGKVCVPCEEGGFIPCLQGIFTGKRKGKRRDQMGSQAGNPSTAIRHALLDLQLFCFIGWFLLFCK